MLAPKTITEATTLAELREQWLLLNVIALRIRISPSLAGVSDELLEAGAHHKTDFYIGTGLTEATAIEAAFAKLRQYLEGTGTS